VRIPKYEKANPTHRKLAQLSRRAHEVANHGELGELRSIEKAINTEAALVWGLTDRELKEIVELL